MELQSVTNAYHSLIAAIIERAIADLKVPEIRSVRCVKDDIDQAMAFILSDTCEAYCLELEIDIEAIREKAAALYRKIIAEEKPRKRRNSSVPGKLPGNRIAAIPIAEVRSLNGRNKKAVKPSVAFKGQSGARRSPYPATAQMR